MEVHAPEHPIHTWRDFFIHIATIVVGLIIAVTLEQTVEWVHHINEVRDTRAALQIERTRDIEIFRENTLSLRYTINALCNNLLVLTYLKKNPGTPESKLPGVLVWPNLYEELSDVAWRTAQSANIPIFMRRDEVSSYAQLYSVISAMEGSSSQSWAAMSKASAYLLIDPDITHLSNPELDREIDLTRDALSAKIRLGIIMANTGLSFSDFTGGPTLKEMTDISIAAPRSNESESLSVARKITKQRMERTPLPF